MLYPVKHQSLHAKELPQRIVNRVVNKALGRYSLPQDLEPPFLPLIRDDPHNFAPHYDLTRAEVAYGNWALPMLMKDLQSPDKQRQYLAIGSLSDMFHDPENLYVAVNLNIIDRLHQFLECPEIMIRESALIALGVACNHYVGSDAVIASEAKSKSEPTKLYSSNEANEKEMLYHNNGTSPVGRLAFILSDQLCALRYKAACVVNNISKSWGGSEGLCKNNFVPVLLNRIKVEESDEVKKELLLALHGCLIYDQHEALSLNGMATLSELLESKVSGIRAAAASCISALLVHPDGKTIAFKTDLLKLLLPLLFSEHRDELANAAGCVSFITMTTPSKLRAVELDIIDRLVFLAGDAHCLQLQLNAVKALTNISEAPKGRSTLLEHYVGKISTIPFNNEEALERAVQTLLKVIRWKP